MAIWHRLSGHRRGTHARLALLGLLVAVVAVVVFVLYALAHKHEPFSSQLWGYLNSGLFKLGAASLLLPLLLFLIEGQFNLAETIRNRRADHLRKERDEKRADRLKVILETASVWAKVEALAGDVVYWDGSGSLTPTLQQLWRMTGAAEETLNSWSRFPNLTVETPDGKRLSDVFAQAGNILIDAARSTSYHLQQPSEDQDRRGKLQQALSVIIDALNFGVHHALLNVLSASLELGDLPYAAELAKLEPDEQAGTDTAAAPGTLNDRLMQIVANSLDLMTTVVSYVDAVLGPRTDPLHGVQDPNVARVRALYDEIRTWPERVSRAPWEHEHFKDLRTCYLAIPQRERLRAIAVRYTADDLLRASDELAIYLMVLRAPAT